jgi:hypothetical protein
VARLAVQPNRVTRRTGKLTRCTAELDLKTWQNGNLQLEHGGVKLEVRLARSVRSLGGGTPGVDNWPKVISSARLACSDPKQPGG